MTSSYRATGQASVRGTPVGAFKPLGAWAPMELTIPLVQAAAAPVEVPLPVVAPEMAAAERASLIREGYARGLADGVQQGIAQSQSQFDNASTALATVIGEMTEFSSLAPAILEENIAALAVIVARQIISREVSLDRELVAELIRRALTEFPVDHTVRIRVHPLDLSVLTAAGSSSDAAPITGSREVSWLADPRVARGGCLVEGRERIVDGRIDTALERAYRLMSKTDAT